MKDFSNTLKIIIADDDTYARTFLSGVIEEIQGITVIGEAETGKELVQLVNELIPDVIFVDVEMPEMNGINAVKEILRLHPKIFVIFATAYRDYGYEAFQVYAVDYLLKPFDSERIINTLKRIQDLKESRQLELIPRLQKLGKENGKLFLQSNDKLNIIYPGHPFRA